MDWLVLLRLLDLVHSSLKSSVFKSSNFIRQRREEIEQKVLSFQSCVKYHDMRALVTEGKILEAWEKNFLTHKNARKFGVIRFKTPLGAKNLTVLWSNEYRNSGLLLMKDDSLT